MIKRAILVAIIWSLAVLPAFAADIFVKSVWTSPSEILTAEEVKAITSKLEGRSAELEEIKEAVTAINQLYLGKKFLTAKAILISQGIEDGVVRIELVEGRIGQYLIKNNDTTKDTYITDRLTLKSGDLVRLDVLEQDIAYFNATNDIQLKAELAAGQKFGETDCVLSVSEPPRFPASFILDNGGRKETGVLRNTISVSDKSFLGSRDTLALNGIYSAGATNLSVSYNRPVSIKGSRIGINYDHSETHIVAGPFESADISGFSSTFGLNYTIPATIQPQLKRYASVSNSANQSDDFFSGVNLISSDFQEVTLSISEQRNGGNWLLYLQQDLTGGYVESSDEDDKGFLKFAGSASLERLTSEGYIFSVKGAYQFSPNELLPSAQQFAIGGMSTVRGYSEGALSGDDGYYLSFELTEQLSPRATGTVFFDHGGAFPFKGNDEPISSSDFATSMGLSATVSFSEHVSGKFTVGYPVFFDGPPRFHLLIQTSL